MSKNSIEKVYNKIIEIGKIRLDTLVNTGRKVKDDMRRDSLYYNEYDSQKYSNVSTLDQLTISNDAFLCLSYKGYNDEQQFESVEVWMNGKNIENFKDFIISAYDEIVTNMNKIYGKNAINKGYEDFVITTGRDEEGNGFGDVDSIGHKVYVYPEVCFTQENEKPYNGVVLCIEDKDGKVVGQEMSISTFGSIATTMDKYDLLIDSRATMIESMLYQILNNSSGTVSSSVGKGGSKPLKSRSGSRITSSNRRPLPTRPSLSDIVRDEEDEDMNDEVEETEVEEVVEKKAPKKNGNKKSVKPATKKTSKVGLSDILNEADDVVFDLDDEEEEY